MSIITENTKHVIDAASLTTVVGTLTAWLPPIAALLSIIWTTLRIYERLSGKEFRKQKTNQISK